MLGESRRTPDELGESRRPDELGESKRPDELGESRRPDELGESKRPGELGESRRLDEPVGRPHGKNPGERRSAGERRSMVVTYFVMCVHDVNVVLGIFLCLSTVRSPIHTHVSYDRWMYVRELGVEDSMTWGPRCEDQ